MVVDRGALAAQHGRRLARRSRRSTAGRAAPARWRWPAAGWRRRRPARWRPARRPRPVTSSGEGHGHAGDVVEPPLGDLVEGDGRGQRQRDAHRPDQLARLPDGLPVAGEVLGQRRPPARRPGRPARASPPARAARAGRRRWGSRCPGCRPGWRRCGSAGTRTAATAGPAAGSARPSSRSASDRVSAAPISMRSLADARTCAARAAGPRPPRTGPAAPRMLTSTPQSVQPAITVASGPLGQQRHRRGQVGRAGRTRRRRPAPGWPARPGAAAPQRRAKVSSAGGASSA